MKTALLFWDGYASKADYEASLALVPSVLSEHGAILVPNFTGSIREDGGFGWAFGSAAVPAYLTALGQSKGAAVVPMVLGSGLAATRMLLDPAKRANYIASALKIVRETGADGIMTDLESLAKDTGPGLTALLKDLKARLHDAGKLSLAAVAGKTSSRAEPWYVQYDYGQLAGYADFILIMAYDYHYAASGPGPVAPLAWVDNVLSYAVSQIPPARILLGIPAYGRSWSHNGSKWIVRHMSMAQAMRTAAESGAVIGGEESPFFRHRDSRGVSWTTFFEDCGSWRVKLALLEKYRLGGSGIWSMRWLDAGSAPQMYSLLNPAGR